MSRVALAAAVALGVAACASSAAHGADLSVLGCEPWIKPGGACEVRSWGLMWSSAAESPAAVAREAERLRIVGRIAHCDSGCVSAIALAADRFCLERGAVIRVHLFREYAGTAIKDQGGRTIGIRWTMPPRAMVSWAPELPAAIAAYVMSQGGWKAPSLADAGDGTWEATDYIQIPEAVAARVWRLCDASPS